MKFHCGNIRLTLLHRNAMFTGCSIYKRNAWTYNTTHTRTQAHRHKMRCWHSINMAHIQHRKMPCTHTTHSSTSLNNMSSSSRRNSLAKKKHYHSPSHHTLRSASHYIHFILAWWCTEFIYSIQYHHWLCAWRPSQAPHTIYFRLKNFQNRKNLYAEQKMAKKRD